MTFVYYAAHSSNSKIIMKHVICTALVILGLVFQPFAFARSDSFSGDDADNSMQTDQTTASVVTPPMKGHSMDMSADDVPMPCHETTLVDANMEDCDDCCDVGCAMIAHCISSSSALSAILQLDHCVREIDSTKLEVRALSARATAAPSIIYHPPIHS